MLSSSGSVQDTPPHSLMPFCMESDAHASPLNIQKIMQNIGKYSIKAPQMIVNVTY